MIVSVDFDGTITESTIPGEPGFNVLAPHCKEVMQELADRGVKFVLLTARRPEYLQEALTFCKAWGLPIDLSTPTTKVGADVYIDDKNLGCTHIDWLKIRRELLSLLKHTFYTEVDR